MTYPAQTPRPGAPPRAVEAVVFGEALIDLFPQTTGLPLEEVEHFVRHPGGAPCNFAVGLCRQGIPAALITQVGGDGFGRFLKKRLAEEGVAVDGITTHKTARTGLTFVSVAQSGARSFLFYRHPSADMLITRAEVVPALIQRGRLFHFGSSTLSAEPSRTATLHALQCAKKTAGERLISCDLNYRNHLWPDPKEAPPLLRNVLSQCHVVKLTEDELPLLSGQESVEQGAAAVRKLGVSVVVVTLGERGAYLDSPQGCAHFSAEKVTVVDRTGAGDAFCAGLLGALLVYLSGPGPASLPQRLGELPLDALKRACLHGIHLASTVLSALGATAGLPKLSPPAPPPLKIRAISKKEV